MIYLILSIICSSAIFLIFKSFQRYGIHTFTAIVINYLTAGCIGFMLNSGGSELTTVTKSSWFVYALVLGAVFITMFNVMAVTSQKLGVSVGSIANKMALIIPVVYAMIYYNDSVTLLKIVGIIVALIGIILSTLKPKTFERNYHKSDLLFPLIVLIGSGFIDTYMKYVEQFLLMNTADFQLFSSTTFSTAFILGALVMVIDKKRRSISLKNLTAGIVLGIINFGSIYFLLEALRNSNLESSVIFPFNNVGVVLLTVQLSYFLFKEKFSKMNLVGIALSVFAVVLIALGR